jgi:Na+/H+ antiporter NhaD/arsenite permease-like protein
VPAVAAFASNLAGMPEGPFTAAVLASRPMSNVPAAIFLEPFTDDWRRLAWGTSVGGFGFALGSLANLIALRLARMPGMRTEFHRWSVPVLACAYAAGLALLAAGA